jgi:hypothetical protein
MLGILRQLAPTAISDQEEDADAEEAAGEYDHFAFEERATDLHVL